MDAKKANLTPELKEIYDRVMNTSNAPKTAVNPAQGQIPQVPPIPQNPTVSSPQAPSMPSVGAPIQADQPQNTALQQPQMDAAPQMPPLPGAPAMPPPTPAEEALTSAPARPLSEGGAFAFNGNAKTASAPQAGEKKKARISKPILIVLGVVFVVVWGVFWAIIFGFIER